MKKLKKFASVAIALIMAMALMAPAFAAERSGEWNVLDTMTGEITLGNTTAGQTYKLYRLLDMTSYGTDSNDAEYGTYRVNEDWRGFFIDGDPTDMASWKYVRPAGFNDGGQLATLKVRGEEEMYNSPVSLQSSRWLNTESQKQDFIQTALAYAEAHGIEPVSEFTPEKNGDWVYRNIPLGWYLLDTTSGALCSLTVGSPSARIADKNEMPTISKSSDVVNNTKAVGDTVLYTITVDPAAGAKNYVVHDTMTHLQFDAGSLAVTVGGTPLTAGVDYTLTTGLEEVDDCTFEVAFSENFLNTITSETDNIVITYNAAILASAALEGEYYNDTQLSFGDGSLTSVAESANRVYKVELTKYTNIEDANGSVLEYARVLDGAKFKLYTVVKHSGYRNVDVPGEEIPVAYDEATGMYHIAKNGEETVEYIEAGRAYIAGLANRTEFMVVEIEAPAGYNMSRDYHKVTVNGRDMVNSYTSDGEHLTGTGTGAGIGLKIFNAHGPVLPETGGMGTTIFYAVGGVLLAGSAILFITKKRMGSGD